MIERLKLHEGKVISRNGLHIPYRDSVGALTIGYGALIDPDHGGGLYEEEAEFLLRNRLLKALDETSNAFSFFEDLSQNRQDVLVEMVFNMGLRRVKGFKKMLQALSEQDYPRAADEMLDSRWARQVKGRANTLAELMQQG